MPAPYSTNGKQVLQTVDGLLADYAQAISPAAALHISSALNTMAGLPVPIVKPYIDEDEIVASLTVDIVSALNGLPVQGNPEFEALHWPAVQDANPRPSHYRAPTVTHRTERQGDEWACTCGARWEGEREEHPA